MTKNICITVLVFALCLTIAASAGYIYYFYDYGADLETEHNGLKVAYGQLNAEYSKLTSGKKAVIILPGIMGSVLVDDQYGKPLYTDYVDIINLLLDVPDAAIDQYLYKFLTSDDDGIPTYSMTPYNTDMDIDTKFQDGMLATYSALRQTLSKVCGDIYDIITWHYDWRLSNATNGAKLEDFIRQKGYSKVMLVAHSMGGQVVSNFLQKKSNRQMVELFIPIAVPFLGAFGAEDAMYQPTYKLSSGIAYLDDYNMDFGSHIGNLASVYELMPHYSGEFGIETHITDDRALTTSELSGLYRGFAKTGKSDGTAKAMLSNLDNYYARMFVDVGGKKVHVSGLVNTEYIVLSGFGTSIGGVYENGVRVSRIYGDGDGVVWNYSASAGQPLDAHNVNLLSRKGHGDVSDKVVLDTIAAIAQRYKNIYNN